MLKNLPTFSDSRGCLTAINKGLEFAPKRIFYIYNVPKGEKRGAHAHIKNKQILVCISGSVKVSLNDGKSVQQYILNKNQSLYIDNMIWDEQTYLTGDEILLAICSEEHSEDDYIRDYELFLKEKLNG